MNAINLSEMLPKHIERLNRKQLKLRFRHEEDDEDVGRCVYCDRSFLVSDLTLDHIIPRSKGGSDDYLNLVAACTSCNLSKGSDDWWLWYPRQGFYNAGRSWIILSQLQKLGLQTHNGGLRHG